MTARPQTIEIFLPSGDPRAIRLAEITTRIVRVIEIPRSMLENFLQMEEASQLGLYFLFGDDEATGISKVYIGQTGSLATRLSQHNAGKEFWNRALVAVSRTNSMTSTHASYLEWWSIQHARAAGRYAIENGNSGAKPHAPPPLEAACTELYETIRVLIATLGYPVFEPLTRPVASTLRQPLGANEAEPRPEGAVTERMYFATGSGADARALYTTEGLVVLAGSTGREEIVPSFEPHGYNRLRQQLIEQGVMVAASGRISFSRDYLFKSPSAAAACLMGRTANGPIEWKDEHGVSLIDLEMKPR